MRRILSLVKCWLLICVLLCLVYILLFNLRTRQTVGSNFRRDGAKREVFSSKDISGQTEDWRRSLGLENVELFDRTIVWAVLAGGNAWALDHLLNSLQGLGVILVAQGQRSASIDRVLERYHTNSLLTPTNCYKTPYIREGCIKNNWLWLMQQAWSLNPQYVCYTAEHFLLHRDVQEFVHSHVMNNINGLILSKGQSSNPWCFGRRVWNHIADKLSYFCSLEEHGWDQSIAHILTNSAPNNKFLVPSKDLALDLTGCDAKHDTCSNKIATFYGESLEGIEARERDWLVPAKKASGGKSTLTEQAQCRAKICKGFQFEQTSDERVYFNHPMDGKGQDAYIIDLGPTCINTSKIHVATGGEKITDVLGRSEEEEFPRYDMGAFHIYDTVPHVKTTFYQKNIIRAAVPMKRFPQKFDFSGTTIAYTRFDYANVCFVVNDLLNLYLTLEHEPSSRMLWLDGHALGNLDNVASNLFDMEVMRIGHMSGVHCFERLVLQPKKYVLYYVERFDSCDLHDFVKTMLKKFNITPAAEKHDTVIVRDYYLAHPRVTKEVTRKYTDEELENIKSKIPEAKFVRFHEFSWKDQLQIIANTKTLYGMHGAGLTLGLFLDRGASMVEWMHPSRVSTLTFPRLMTWRPDVKFSRLYLKQWLAKR